MPVKDVFQIIKARMMNPTIGTYIMALSTLNWRVWILLFSGERTPEERIDLVANYLRSPHFTDSFWIGAGASLIYLYALPFLIERLESIQRRIAIYRKVREDAFDARLNEAARLGGSCETLATSMKRDLSDFVNIAKRLDSLIKNTHRRGDNPNVDAELAEVRKLLHTLAPLTEEALESMSEILNAQFGKTTAQLSKEFAVARKKVYF